MERHLYRKKIIDIVCWASCVHFEISRRSFLENTRQRATAQRRWVFSLICYYYFSCSDTELSKFLKLDRETVTHGIKELIDLISIDKDLQRDVNEVKRIADDAIKTIFIQKIPCKYGGVGEFNIPKLN